jgi:predicted nucleic acid-binding protein
MPESNVHFIDTNIWLYSLLDTGEAEKTKVAQALIKSSEAIVSVQVISEVCANLVKKAKMPESEIRKFVEGIYAKHRVVELEMRVFLFASELREEYTLSFWDSLILSSAFLSGAEIIFSEDMQDGLVIRESLKIVNPFKS